MSIERELLIKIKEDMKGLKFTPDFIDEIDRLLAQPEPEPVACSLSFLKGYSRGFCAGVNNAEKYYSIGGGE